MSTVVFCPHPERGHVNPVLRIAKRLKQRGHRIAFAGPPDVGDLLEDEGMEFIPVLTELLPRGMLAERTRTLHARRGLARLREARRMVQLSRAVFEELVSGGVARVTRSVRPDVMICDSLYPELAVLAHGLGVPYLLLNTTVPVPPQRLIPPIYSHIIPRDDLATRLAVARIDLPCRIQHRVKSLMGIAVDKLGELKRLARRCGFPLDKVKRGSTYTELDVPELVLCPREFTEFSVPSQGLQYHYVEPSIDLSRREPDFPWERLRQGAPLIYCSLGSQSGTWARGRLWFFQQVAEAAGHRPHWDVVLAVGGHLDTRPLHAPNVLCVEYGPQIGLLRRATAMITHAGFNSVKECIYFGVPMLVTPFLNDQPGIAARVVHHGLGVRAFPESITAGELLRLLDGLLADPGYRQRMASMSRIFRAAEDEGRSVEVIERWASRAGAAG
ncbi:MAG TPA: nucleotide disphospho-sugar-binding domain-containing protein [Myxococcales bacterium]|nr:nucleotide disphospho-sugar-binding domain-containing protein [Myxococcales bacterium]